VSWSSYSIATGKLWKWECTLAMASIWRQRRFRHLPGRGGGQRSRTKQTLVLGHLLDFRRSLSTLVTAQAEYKRYVHPIREFSW
jgi:hypothetical protein